MVHVGGQHASDERCFDHVFDFGFGSGIGLGVFEVDRARETRGQDQRERDVVLACFELTVGYCEDRLIDLEEPMLCLLAF